MPGRNGAVARGPAPPIARTFPVRSPGCTEDGAQVSDDGIPEALTRRPPDMDPPVELAGPARDSAVAGQPTPVPPPDR